MDKLLNFILMVIAIYFFIVILGIFIACAGSWFDKFMRRKNRHE